MNLYDIWILPDSVSTGLPESLDDVNSDPNEWYSIPRLEKSPTLTVDKAGIEELNDGTFDVVSEKIDFEAGTFAVTSDVWEYLRDFNNQYVDVAMIDRTNQLSFVLHQVKVHFSEKTKSGENIMIMMKASREVARIENHLALYEDGFAVEMFSPAVYGDAIYG